MVKDKSETQIDLKFFYNHNQHTWIMLSSCEKKILIIVDF